MPQRHRARRRNMSASSFTLDYELTRDDMQAAFERSRRQIRPSWIRRIGACFVIGIAFDGWQDHAWWFTAMLLLLGLELWTSPLWMDWVIRKFVSLPADPMHIQIEADDRSLRIHDASRPV